MLFPFIGGIASQTPSNNTTFSTPQPTNAMKTTPLQATCPKTVQYITKPFLARLK
ncbi:hypothetical protein M9458_001375, partial [Cirrhinus mrigala]